MPSRTTRKSTRPEPQIDPWLPTCNRRACQFQKPIGVVATKPKDEPRWNNARPDAGPEDKKAKPNASYSGQGLEIKEKFLHFRLREKNVLDIPSYRSGDSTF